MDNKMKIWRINLFFYDILFIWNEKEWSETWHELAGLHCHPYVDRDP